MNKHILYNDSELIYFDRRDWKPLGPSAATEDVMDEYRWDVDTAFNALLKSSWTYECAKVTDAESLFKSEYFKKDLESIVIVHPIFASADTNFVRTTVTGEKTFGKSLQVFKMAFQGLQLLLTNKINIF